MPALYFRYVGRVNSRDIPGKRRSEGHDTDELIFVDWKEDLHAQLGTPGAWALVQALGFVLGFSRKTVVWFSFRKDPESFLAGHQEAIRRIGIFLTWSQCGISFGKYSGGRSI